MTVEKIKIDGGTLTKAADGKVSLGGAGCLTWTLLVLIGMATLGALAMMPSVVIRFLDPADDVSLGNVFQFLGIILFLGFATFYLYNRARRGRVIIDPAAKLITIGKRQIPFAEVESIISKGAEIPTMRGAVLVTFYVALKSGRLESLGSLSGNPKKIDPKVVRVLTILGQTIMGSSTP